MDVPRPLRLLWVLCWALIIAAIVFTLFAVLSDARWLAGPLVVVAVPLIWRLLGRPLSLDVLGDAVRYLTPHPANVAHRQTIRRAGVDLIKSLHNSGDYDRIILLGHSLGSVIAYDIITHAWTELHKIHRHPRAPSFKKIVAVECSLKLKDAGCAQEVQRDAWYQTRANTQPWLITDLVTVGSPLTYADFLITSDCEKFKKAKKDRTLPTCPPESEEESKTRHSRVTYDCPYGDVADGRARTFALFHHAAPFAVTCWTNLYFEPRHLGFTGDLIGGPVSPLFGLWVRDVQLPAIPRFAHSCYWRSIKGVDDGHLKALQTALNLNIRDELLGHVKNIPGFALLSDPKTS